MTANQSAPYGSTGTERWWDTGIPISHRDTAVPMWVIRPEVTRDGGLTWEPAPYGPSAGYEIQADSAHAALDLCVEDAKDEFPDQPIVYFGLTGGSDEPVPTWRIRVFPASTTYLRPAPAGNVLYLGVTEPALTTTVEL